MQKDILIKYILGIADNSLILGQRLGELTGHGPTLEVDIAMTNISLDLFGQVRSYFQYTAQLSEEDKTEDDFAFLRKEREYINVLLVEQPNRDFGYTIARQFLFDHFHFLFLNELQNSKDKTLVAIAKKSLKEVSYHRRFSSDWIKRLGDGTEESKRKIQIAINDLWRFTEELFHQTNADVEAIKEGIGIDTDKIKAKYLENVSEVLAEAMLEKPDLKFFQEGGKKGIHSEHMGYLLNDMQYMQRTYPGMKW
ncbi:1,2-phenylacetyl-CoA epoxidase subunit PaaC [Mesonia aestuariivivens]|uniref:Phenylacetate-CoA oxygenase subunit PaaC n=1 Tax=Mesonia aestuariivivens TaxID=2796128 RepID=A0ABS6W3C9_9FLAO|nr:1,2-phenylacetyl-CoA epoxidase subunit PaaC [Mesonia aestuariivivens]MBW2962365.1 phenylacetate-CoA oxygenase subunit PaaC [Mesonia aestuariivivens]